MNAAKTLWKPYGKTVTDRNAPEKTLTAQYSYVSVVTTAPDASILGSPKLTCENLHDGEGWNVGLHVTTHALTFKSSKESIIRFVNLKSIYMRYKALSKKVGKLMQLVECVNAT